jgi:hypothetical protein
VCGDAGAGGHGDAGALSVYEFTLAGVDAGAHLDAERYDALADLSGAVEGEGAGPSKVA